MLHASQVVPVWVERSYATDVPDPGAGAAVKTDGSRTVRGDGGLDISFPRLVLNWPNCRT